MSHSLNTDECGCKFYAKIICIVMRIAVALRGVSYLENYYHRYNLPRFTVDYKDVLPAFKQNVVQAFQRMGHDVDIFINTYHNKHDEDVVKDYNPVACLWKEYQEISSEDYVRTAEPMLIDRHLECFDLITQYEDDNNFKYDMVLVTRFDLYYYMSLEDVQLDFTCFNFTFWHIADHGRIFSSEDNFVLFPRAKLDLFRSCLLQMKADNESTHLSGKYLLDRGEIVKYLFGEKGDGAYDYPLFKFGRHLFGINKVYNVEDIPNVAMNRIFHSVEEQINPRPIYKAAAV